MKVAVIGAGTMGNGIAHTFAQSGYNVHLVDISQESLDRGMNTISKNLDRMVTKEKITTAKKEEVLSNITTFTGLEDGVKEVQLVVEAATENVDLKLKIFKSLDAATGDDCILATNTSSISITQIAAVTTRPEKVIGMHFMNPVPIMKLVEIIRGYSTSDETTSTIMGMAHPMGPLQLADFIGLDVCLSILEVMHDGFKNPKYAPCPLLVNMVRAGKLGVKSGEGFYDYSESRKAEKVAAMFMK